LVFAARETVVRFVQEAATYAYQLNVLVPMLCHINGVPMLGDHIRGLLNRLRGLRTDIAHEGHPEDAVSAREAAEVLTAAVFGYHYAKFFRAAIADAKARGDQTAR
jgi:hypothetical protein